MCEIEGSFHPIPLSLTIVIGVHRCAVGGSEHSGMSEVGAFDQGARGARRKKNPDNKQKRLQQKRMETYAARKQENQRHAHQFAGSATISTYPRRFLSVVLTIF